LPDDQIVCLCESCTSGLEIVHNGNERAGLLTLNTARELNKLDHIILGTDGPAGSGVQPLGILRMVAMLSSLGNVPAEIAFCFANGNTARQRELDTGLIEEGYCADFVLMDQAQHSPGKTILESVEQGAPRLPKTQCHISAPYAVGFNPHTVFCTSTHQRRGILLAKSSRTKDIG